MTSNNIRKAYLDFFKSKNHAIIPPAPLIPQNDPTTLFNGSGMQQLVPYLKGQEHPMGKRLVNTQPCFRAEDIEEVGDNRHTTYFEMLGNWSLGDYFKKDQLSWFWEFLIKILNLPKEKLYITVFKGNKYAPKDEESIKIWKSLGISDNHIYQYPAKKNWWSRTGTPDKMPVNEIGGSTSEVFFEFTNIKHNPKFGKKCHPNCNCGRFIEIGNSVFMQYVKSKNDTFKLLPNNNVDFGGGLERLTQAVENTPDIFQIDIFKPIISSIEKITNKKYKKEFKVSMRIIADHLRATKAMLGQGIMPSSKQQGYILRRLIRRSAIKFKQLTGELKADHFSKIINEPILIHEINKFQKSLNKGLKELKRADPNQLNSLFAFDLYQTYGFPFEDAKELIEKKGGKVDINEFKNILKKHRELSRITSVGMFKGGLADQSKATTKLHTTTHLLHQSLRQVLGNHVKQVGSNITSERLRFDFTNDKPLTQKELKQIENLINQKIKDNLPVIKTIENKEDAFKRGVIAFFKGTYPDKVSVYSIGDFSKELCGGPHVSSTSEIGNVKIIKEKSIAAGKRRIYMALNETKKSTN